MAATGSLGGGRQTIERIFSAIQTSGALHLGNYIGAIQPWLSYQAQKAQGNLEASGTTGPVANAQTRIVYALADLHAMTSLLHRPAKPGKEVPPRMDQLTMQLATELLACGLDPKHSLLVRQSHVLEHTMLAWLLTCLTPIGKLRMMTQFKSKAGESDSSGRTGSDGVNTGLLTYPILQAADILLYKATHVPIGADQVQHLELTRDLAHKVNLRLLSLHPDLSSTAQLPLPEPLVRSGGVGRIMNLRDPRRKMSKSDTALLPGCIFLADDADTVRRKVMGAVTDAKNKVRLDAESQPGVTNLARLLMALTGMSREAVEARYAGLPYPYPVLKADLAEAIVETLKPIHARRTSLEQDPEQVMRVLRSCEDEARQMARATLASLSSLLHLSI